MGIKLERGLLLHFLSNTQSGMRADVVGSTSCWIWDTDDRGSPDRTIMKLDQQTGTKPLHKPNGHQQPRRKVQEHQAESGYKLGLVQTRAARYMTKVLPCIMAVMTLNTYHTQLNFLYWINSQMETIVGVESVVYSIETKRWKLHVCSNSFALMEDCKACLTA